MSITENTSIYCGWGRIIIGNSFSDPAKLAAELIREKPGKRDIAFYVEEPQLVLSYAPQQLFLDPSDAFRLDLSGPLPQSEQDGDIQIRRVVSPGDAERVNDLYLKRAMVPTDPDYIWEQRDAEQILFLVAEDLTTGEISGTVMGLNHQRAYGDPSAGASLWCLAVDPQAERPGIGHKLVCALAAQMHDQGCAYLDLSVMHDNEEAKQLYQKLGFAPIRVFAIKNKNSYNEALFLGPDLDAKLNPYAQIIIDEARSRGITVAILDAAEGYFRLSRGGKSITCRESLCDLTSAIAMSRCQDKYVTHRWLQKIELRTPAFQLAADEASNLAFLEHYGRVVVKPAVGEQGQGISVGVADAQSLARAIAKARHYSDRVLLESFHPGQDLRIVVINYQVVAAATRRPAQIIGDGHTSARVLIEKMSRRREAATAGESKIPIDEETEQLLAEHELSLDAVVERDRIVPVRKTANLHTGGTIHDVTAILHPRLAEVAQRAARHLEIPVVGLDLMVNAADEPDYVIIEANERVGLANHEPRPTAQRFVDLLFPLSVSTRAPQEPS